MSDSLSRRPPTDPWVGGLESATSPAETSRTCRVSPTFSCGRLKSRLRAFPQESGEVYSRLASLVCAQPIKTLLASGPLIAVIVICDLNPSA